MYQRNSSREPGLNKGYGIMGKGFIGSRSSQETYYEIQGGKSNPMVRQRRQSHFIEVDIQSKHW
jgi:hypothetical protein